MHAPHTRAQEFSKNVVEGANANATQKNKAAAADSEAQCFPVPASFGPELTMICDTFIASNELTGDITHPCGRCVCGKYFAFCTCSVQFVVVFLAWLLAQLIS